ncbi:undecaprenyl-diphosphate phosphatase [Oscillatoria amoena NRMC-F 0135]|nr:undecaprenyl-diphosphate phosphatase [Oscillatoria amoena NRMC-F 0135]
MSIIQAILLAIIEGLTEFLPVSSTGHIIIGSSLMGLAADPFTKLFTVAIQFGAILSVFVLYWKKFLQSFDFYLKLLIAFIPAAVIGLLLDKYIDAWLERVDVVGYALVAGGIFFLFVDRLFIRNEENSNQRITNPVALKIGLFQCVALMPGISRSAATIIGGLTQSLNKKNAAEFSFFLAVPTLFAAAVYKLLSFAKSGAIITSYDILLLFIGNAVAFVVAMLAIKSFIGFLTQHGFKAFGYYRIAVGITILLLYHFGIELAII